jgi:hypothetical protein
MDSLSKAFLRSKAPVSDSDSGSDSESESDDIKTPEKPKLTRQTNAVPETKQVKSGDELFDKLKNPAVYIMCGKSKQGKSFMSRSIIKRQAQAGQFKCGLVFTTTKFNGGYNWLPSNMVITGYDENILKKYLNKMKHYRETHNDTPLPNFIVFDDCGHSVNWNDPLLSVFINTPRHFGTSVFIMVQFCRGLILPNVREQADYVFLWNQRTAGSIQATYENFGTGFENLDKFKQTLNAVTKTPYQCLFVNNDETEFNKRYCAYIAPKEEPDIVLNFGATKEKKDEENEHKDDQQNPKPGYIPSFFRR